MGRYWVGVVSQDHVERAVEGGFFQANHGKEAPLKRMAKGDGVVFYSPRTGMRVGEEVHAFTAIGTVSDDVPYQAVQTEQFRPFRRRVTYRQGERAPIRPLLERLSFSQGNPHWGQILRRGFFEIKAADFALIEQAMGVRSED